MSHRRPSHRAAVAIALVVTFLWSTSWVLIRVGLDEESLAPISFAALRYGVAAIVLLTVLVGRRTGRAELASLRPAELARVAVLGVVLIAITQGAQFVAIDAQPAATTSLVLSLTPLLVAATASGALGELPSSRQIWGAGLVALGAWSYFSGGLGFTAVGITASVVALAANAGAALLGRHVNRSTTLSPLAVTAVAMSTGAVLLLVGGVAVEGVPAVTPRAWMIVGWLAVVNTALAFTLWNRSLRTLAAVESAGINNTMLVQIALLAWVFLGERPGLPEWAGIAAVAVGITLIQVSGRTGRSRPTAG